MHIERNRLTRQDTRKLEDFILAEWERIKTVRPPLSSFARAAGTQLGFKVNDGNVRGALIALGLIWPRDDRKLMNPAQSRYAFQISELATALVQLSTALNEPVRPSLREMILQPRQSAGG